MIAKYHRPIQILALILFLCACQFLPQASQGIQPTNPLPDMGPTATIEDPNLIFKDDFSGDGGYLATYSADDGKGEYIDHSYRITIQKDTNYIFGSSFGGIGGGVPKKVLSTPELAEVAIDVDVIKTNGPSSALYGVVCGVKGEADFYGLWISSDATHYSITRSTNKISLDLLAGQDRGSVSFKIKTGERATNHIHAECSEKALILNVNGQNLAEVVPPTPPSGGVGVAALTRGLSPVEVQFNDFVVHKLTTTPQVAATQNSDWVIFSDDFSDPASGWMTGSINGQTGTAEYKDGVYQITEAEKDQYVYLAVPALPQQAVRAEIDTKLNKATKTGYSGIGCYRRSGQDHYLYQLEVSPQGFYSILSQKNDEAAKVIVDWTKSSNIVGGQMLFNHLRVDCVADKLVAYINSQKQQEVTLVDSPAEYVQRIVLLTGGSTGNNDPIVASFDNFSTRKP